MRLSVLCLLYLTSVLPSLFGQTLPTGELRKWHCVTLTFDGPETDELAAWNPFLHYRMEVVFRHDSATYRVPGYFAADGNAANSSATGGNKWRVHFAPDHEGEWQWTLHFRKGINVAVSAHRLAGEALPELDGQTGTFRIGPTNKKGRDFRARGRLLFQGRQYPVFAETGEYFIKSGTDAPENLLAYADFDGDFKTDGRKDALVKRWSAHVRDWRPGDPTWQDGKGKGLIGAVNYLASEGLNVFSFLTNNIAGDDQNVFPYVDYQNYERIDVSRMDQWDVVFRHGQQLGMFLHFKTSEVENQGLLDGGELGVQRKLYFRELLARFGYHLALNWNLGEENGLWGSPVTTPIQTTTQRLAMARYFYENDPYRHHVVIHNGQAFYDLLGPESQYTGLSLQTNKPDFRRVYGQIRYWLDLAREAGVNWAVAVDEPGDAQHSLVPDKDNDGTHDFARQNALWASIMAGGWGSEWYFGYKHDHSDLSCRDFRSRDLFWDQVRHHLRFMQTARLPLARMHPANALSSSDNDWVLAAPGEVYLLLLKMGEKPDNQLTVPNGTYQITWYNPRTGAYPTPPLEASTPQGSLALPLPPGENDMDWVLLVRRSE